MARFLIGMSACVLGAAYSLGWKYRAVGVLTPECYRRCYVEQLIGDAIEKWKATRVAEKEQDDKD